MKHAYTYFLLLLVSVLLSESYAQTQPKGGSLVDIGFIEGHWKATTPEGRTIEAVWLAPENDNILGFMRMMKDGKADLYEILAYEKSEQGLVSLVKHFKPGLLDRKKKTNRTGTILWKRPKTGLSSKKMAGVYVSFMKNVRQINLP